MRMPLFVVITKNLNICDYGIGNGSDYYLVCAAHKIYFDEYVDYTYLCMKRCLSPFYQYGGKTCWFKIRYNLFTN